MANIVKVLKSIISGNIPSLSQLAQSGQIAINEADGRFFFLNSNNSPSIEGTFLRGLDYSARAYTNISGGGTIAWTAAGVSWSSRFMVASNGREAAYAPSGYFEISMPANGTVIAGLGGASNATVANGAIPLNSWDVLYYILPLKSSNASVSGNFRIVNYTSNSIVPPHWIPLVINNGDDATMKFPNGVVLDAGDSYNTTLGVLGNSRPTESDDTIYLNMIK